MDKLKWRKKKAIMLTDTNPTILKDFFKKAEVRQKNLYIKTHFINKTYFRRYIMEVAITKMSPNGQVVIPSEIRKEAGLNPSTKFIVFNEGGNILLKQINKKALKKDIELIEKIALTESQINGGKSTQIDTSMNDEEIDDLLMS